MPSNGWAINHGKIPNCFNVISSYKWLALTLKVGTWFSKLVLSTRFWWCSTSQTVTRCNKTTMESKCSSFPPSLHTSIQFECSANQSSSSSSSQQWKGITLSMTPHTQCPVFYDYFSDSNTWPTVILLCHAFCPSNHPNVLPHFQYTSVYTKPLEACKKKLNMLLHRTCWENQYWIITGFLWICFSHTYTRMLWSQIPCNRMECFIQDAILLRALPASVALLLLVLTTPPSSLPICQIQCCCTMPLHNYGINAVHKADSRSKKFPRPHWTIHKTSYNKVK